jgi:hypothetical protein
MTTQYQQSNYERNPVTLLTEAADADRALKAKRRAIWASGDYEAVARRSSRRWANPGPGQPRSSHPTGFSMYPPEPATPAFLPQKPALTWSPPTSP